jgi:NDP-sugar pyrophosphorylase family protein
MAGRGSRFAVQGVTTPKPLVPVAGRPMLWWALQSLREVPYSEIVFVCLEEHETEYGVTRIVQELAGDAARVVLLPEVTEGQLCTVLAAREYLVTDEDVLVMASDTYVRSALGAAVAQRPAACRGLISVADLPGDRWSFARTGPDGAVVEVTEKVRISDHASTGMYYFASGRELVDFADEMIRSGRRARGEYYVMPVYQLYLEAGLRIELVQAEKVLDFGSPEALAEALPEARVELELLSAAAGLTGAVSR